MSRCEGDLDRNPLQRRVQGVAPGCTRVHRVAPRFARKVAFETFLEAFARANAGCISAMLEGQTRLASDDPPAPAATAMTLVGAT